MKLRYYIYFLFLLTLPFWMIERGFSAEKMSRGTLAKLESAPQAEIYFKNSKAFIFTLVKSDQELRIRDSVFVGPQSEAKLKFSADYGGGTILLGPNTIVTLIQTGKANDIPTVEIKQGSAKVVKEPGNGKLMLITHESKAVVFNSSLKSTELKVLADEKLAIVPIGAPAQQKSETSPPPVVFDLAKIQNLEPQPLREFVRQTPQASAKTLVSESVTPIAEVKSKPKTKPKLKYKPEPAKAPVEPKNETSVAESRAVVLEPVLATEPTVSPKKRSNLSSNGLIFAGLSNLNYEQTASPSFQELILTLKGAYRLSISEHLDLGISGEASALPLLSSDGIKLRFFRSNVNLGFSLPFVSSPWRLAVYPGMYFSTTKSSGFIIGFSELYGAELIALIERSFNSNNRLGLSLRFAPVLNSTSIEIGNREVGMGITYSFPPSPKKRYFSIQGDFTSLEVMFNTIQVSSKIVSLGASYNW